MNMLLKLNDALRDDAELDYASLALPRMRQMSHRARRVERRAERRTRSA
ncbi:MAG: hypothetical protein ACFBZ9_16395 [Sphingomonadales bacterium]